MSIKGKKLRRTAPGCRYRLEQSIICIEFLVCSHLPGIREISRTNKRILVLFSTLFCVPLSQQLIYPVSFYIDGKYNYFISVSKVRLARFSLNVQVVLSLENIVCLDIIYLPRLMRSLVFVENFKVASCLCNGDFVMWCDGRIGTDRPYRSLTCLPLPPSLNYVTWRGVATLTATLPK